MKKLSKQLYLSCVGCVQWGGKRYSCLLSFFISQPDDGQCKGPKHVVVL